VIVEDQSLVPAFKDFQVSSGQPAQPSAPPTTPTQAPPPSPSPVTPPPSSATPTAPTPVGRIIASPFAKKVATDKGISLQNVQGSGPGGRIIASDVMSAMSNVAVGGVATTPTSSLYEDISLSGMRKTIAARLLQSKQTIPHYYLTVDIEMDQLLKLRESVNGTSDEFKLSLNDFIIKACSLALIKIPEANSSWMDTFIRQYTNADISVAVSTEGGLITPIIFEANNKGLKTISSEMRSLAEKARSGRLQPHEYQGGTFTISNLGMYGISNFSAVINPPQSCILAIGGTDKRVIVGEDGSYKTASMMSVTMSCDHRVVDGAVGAQWLQVFKSYLENPYKMLL
jgi:pyruvate dehydrogenase E2 component (dihydrolipoamide acetyltransferase)